MKRKHPLGGLMAFIGESEWRGIFSQLLDEHLVPTLDAFGLTTETLIKVLGQNRTALLWGCILEDLVTRYVGFQSDNVVDAYLSHAANSKRDKNQAYMVALRQSVMSLYKVIEATPGEGVVLLDAIRIPATTLVHFDARLQRFSPGDWIAARLIPDGAARLVTGSLLSLSPESAENVLDEMESFAGKLGFQSLAEMGHAELHLLAPVFTQAWLLENLPSSFDLSPVTGRN